MGYLALYRKYRPVNFDDVYGQENIVKIIKNAILCNRVSHAYLFCGPRGTGKTTIAKIIARMVNCEHLIDGHPCGECFNCKNFLNSNDIVEIDAASNNGVDEIRELRDKVNLVPSNSKYKVYIIDEVHMLTTQAFNALLKTLEEPPSHVIFILATTEPYKIPLTISSRCQKFNFSKIDDALIVDRLKNIAKLESISVDDDALFEIARLADGGMRDAINLLDQVVAYTNSHISLDDVYKVNGSVSYSDIGNLLESIASNKKIKIINFIDKIDTDGKDINKFVEEFIIFIKDVILYKNAQLLSSISKKNDVIKLISDIYDYKKLYDLIDTLNNSQNSIKYSSHGFIIFLTSILKFSDNNFSIVEENISREIKKIELSKEKETIDSENNQKVVDETLVHSTHTATLEEMMPKEVIDIRINNALASASKEVLKEIKLKWKSIDEYIYDDIYSNIAGLLKDSVPVVASCNYLIIANNYDSIVDRINTNYKLISDLFRKVFEYDLSIVSVTDEKWNDIKTEYIENIKKGIKYNIRNEEISEKNKKENASIDDLIDLIGSGAIEHK